MLETAIMTILLGIADTAATYIAVGLGEATELNPLMRLLITFGWWHFALVKIALTIAASFTLYALRQHRAARVAAVGCMLFMCLVCTWHVTLYML